MTEPDVALTDYAIALECAILSALVSRWNDEAVTPSLRRWWMLFFASIGAGALLGGTVHGFFVDEASRGHQLLWPATLLCLGITSLSMWMIGTRSRVSEPAATWLRRFAVAQFVVYAVVVLFVDSRFIVAIAIYLPATVFLLVVMWQAYLSSRARPLAIGVTGLLLTFVAAAVQQLRIAVHPVYFNHNALYHVIQAVAIAMIFVSARSLATSPPMLRHTV